jgi:malonate decarboxylase epsilon subunit
VRDAVRLVDLRGRLMAEVAPADSGMLAVDGLPAEQVASAADAARERGAQVWASNVNAPLRSTVSGAGRDLEAFEAVLRGLGARRVTRLSVAAPAHTPLMAPVETALRDALSRVRLAAPSLPVAGNVTGRTLTTADALRDDLARSVSRGLRWDVGTAILAERGADVWVQVPPGRALLGLLPDDATGLALEDLGLDETAARVRAATLR